MVANLIYLIALCLGSPLVAYRVIRHGRYRRGIGQKLTGLSRSKAKILRGDGECIWIHAVSVGEVNLLGGLIDRLRKANEERGITLLVIEHNMRVIMNLAEHIYCLAHGKILADGTPDEIQDNQNVIDAYLGAQ